jgi:beta-lactamase regulating signal transducer with metallopeptidase domain
MPHLSYSFCMSMLHSLWQAGLLFLVYCIAGIVTKNKISPLQKRNFLFVLLLTQLTVFIGTFLVYFLNIENTTAENYIAEAINGAVTAGTIALIAPYLFVIYIFVIGYKLVKAFYQWHSFKKQYKAGLQKPAIDLKLFTLLKADHFGIKRKVQLWLSDTIKVPVTFGFLKPVIILPVALVNQLSIAQAETLILHELSHIKANDYLLNWVLIIVENIFFFNPFILSLCNSIRLEREKYCDSNVIAFEYSPLLYAETLLQAQQVQQFIPQYQIAAVKGKKQLLQRIQFFANKKNFSYYNRPKFILPVCSVLFAVFLTATVFFQYHITANKKPATDNTVTSSSDPLNTEVEMPAFVTNVVEHLTDENLKKIQEIVEQQQPAIEKQVEKLQPMIQAIQEKAEVMANEIANNYLVTPVALTENTITKQIVVKEEQSGSKNATLKVYTVSFINGEWVIVPDWMLAAKEVKADSLQADINDTSLIKKQE